MRVLSLLLISLLALVTLETKGQCVVINEIMINPAGSCDGTCDPNTAEWTELYNTCNTPVDISCYVLTDGDFTVTIPQGTTIPAQGYYVIGSINSNYGTTSGIVDLFLGSCLCTSGSLVGVYTNPNEQAILVDGTGNIVDAIYWGGGQFPVNINSSGTVPGCTSQTITMASSANATGLPLAGPDGSTWARPCDGSPGWAVNAPGLETPGAPNSVPPPPTPAFSASATSLCGGQCITFTSTNPTAGLTYNWTFPGGTPASVNGINPPPICYNTAGTYSATLVLSNACGTSTTTLSNYITVVIPPTPVVSPAGPLSLCNGASTLLQVTSGAGPYQWFQNGVALAGSTSNSLTVTVAGTYWVQSGTGACVVNSNQVVVTQQNLAAPIISLTGGSSFCSGASSSSTLNVTSGTGTYQWILAGTPIPGETAPSLSVTQAGTYWVALSSNGCTTISNQVTISSGTAPNPVISVSGTVICGAGPLSVQTNPSQGSYQWQLNGTDIPGATSNVYNATLAGSYTVVVTNAGGCTGSSTPVALTQQPFLTPSISPSGNQTICSGSSLVLTAAAGAGATYQWTLNGANISSATNSTLTVTQAGNYAVTVIQGSCSATASAVQVSVNPSPTPVISSVGPLLICPGQTQVLTLNQSFSSYQWFLNGSPIPGETFGSTNVNAAGSYSVTVSNSSGCTASAVGPVVTISTLAQPLINVSPSSTICNGQATNLSTTPGLGIYQWLYTGAPVTGANSPNLAASQGGNYAVQVTDALGCTVVSDPVNILVTNINTGIWVPGPTSFCDGGNVTLTAQNLGAAYTWLQNGLPVPGGNTASLVVTESGVYSVEIVQGACSVTSISVSVSVFGATPPVITSNPGLALCPGSTISLSTSGPFAQYQWLLNGTPIAGATNNTFTAGTAGTYSVEGTETFTWLGTQYSCPVTSTNTVVFNGQVPTPALSGPSPLVLCAATSANLNVSGTFASCQWFLNGSIIPGATSATYSANAAGAYTVTAVSVDGCTASSGTQNVQVLPAVSVALTNTGQGSFCQGNQTLLQATAGFTTYQWLQNGTTLVTNTSNQLSVAAAGTYRVVVTNANGCTGTSASLSIVVFPLPSPSITSANGLFEICPGDSLLLQSPQNFAAYQWSQGAPLTPGNGQQQWVFAPGGISLQVTDANGCSASAVSNITTAPVPMPVITAPANGLCAGIVLTLSTGAFSSFEWFLNGTSVASGSPTFIAAQVGNYTVRVENAQGCADTSAVFQVLPSAIPPPAINTSVPAPCAGEPVLLTASSAAGNITWSNGQSGAQLVVFAPGTYTATVTASNGCKSDSSFTVVYKPKPTISLGPDQTVICERAVFIEARAQGTYVWSPITGLSNPGDLYTRALPEVTTHYVLTAQLNGCTASDSVLISVEACETLWIPNSFSPNSDGKNDEFKAIGNDIGAYSLEIYDRWGQRMFSSTDPEQGWDGTVNGSKAPSGVYVWRIEVFNTQGKRMRTDRGDMGTVTLLR